MWHERLVIDTAQYCLCVDDILDDAKHLFTDCVWVQSKMIFTNQSVPHNVIIQQIQFVSIKERLNMYRETKRGRSRSYLVDKLCN